MTSYELYIFFLCLIVFVLLTGLLTALLVILIKQMHKLIAAGIEDEKIKTEYIKYRKESPFVKFLCGLLTLVMVAAMLGVFSISVYLKLNEKTHIAGIPMPKVVMSASMSKAGRNNAYLQANGLSNQLQMFDLILVHELPEESELKLYDVVVYENVDGDMIIHRIVKIEEPNANHPDQRLFTLRGDANDTSDAPITYSRMRGIYRDERVPNVGSFIVFMQSPAGYLCILLILFAVIATPIVEKKLWVAKIRRLREMQNAPIRSRNGRMRLRLLHAIVTIIALIAIPWAEYKLWKKTIASSPLLSTIHRATKRPVKKRH